MLGSRQLQVSSFPPNLHDRQRHLFTCQGAIGWCLCVDLGTKSRAIVKFSRIAAAAVSISQPMNVPTPRSCTMLWNTYTEAMEDVFRCSTEKYPPCSRRV